jgi:hypothetical protein
VSFSGNCFGQLISHILFIEKELTVKVMVLDKISIDNPDLANASTH